MFSNIVFLYDTVSLNKKDVGYVYGHNILACFTLVLSLYAARLHLLGHNNDLFPESLCCAPNVATFLCHHCESPEILGFL